MGNTNSLTSKHSHTMEDELTCPVCLELFADPLLLPCSHSICKKCLQDIVDNRSKSGKDGLDCPTCRKSHPINRNKVGKLTRNLALENIVFRYQEIQSQNLSRSRNSLDLTLDFFSPTSPVPASCIGSGSVSFDSAMEPWSVEDGNELCGLCEENVKNKASLYCEQCCVAYCHTCLDTFHPRRGPLAHHKLRSPTKSECSGKEAYCDDHVSEVAAIFCDRCKQLVCHLCVCDGIGKHSQHKILAIDTALAQTKEVVSQTKTKLETMVTTLSDQMSKLEEMAADIEKMHSEASEKIDTQHQRLVEDLMTCLRQQRQTSLQNVTETKSRVLTKYRLQIEESHQQLRTLDTLVEDCKVFLDEDHPKGLLSKAGDVALIVQQQEIVANKMGPGRISYQELVSDKTSQQEIKTAVATFYKSAHATLNSMLDEGEQCRSLIPVIKSSASLSKEGPHVVNKCLTTWGFNSSSFTAEPLEYSAMWSVTIEKNASQLGDLKTGYIFGVGISFEKLTAKDQVGINRVSHGIICTAGSLAYSHDGKIEQLMPLDSLPLSVTIYCTIDESDKVLLAYTITDTNWGDSLHGKKVLVDQSSKNKVFPVFTVSQRVKMQFPTYV
ncbi:probable E3 ubiquitin-protein ligase MID2 isoform X2 [Mya arenaria]|uniref:probable E3 ubiquitin-protein ligase MID2 isoform X2 n=1 Tax=Mya arenaria TaxID=6604 RepID=UPI0022E858A9|nr:probable E3 ubiquitin-protein ligase MID2 isoform X2 [Mya arenaria]